LVNFCTHTHTHTHNLHSSIMWSQMIIFFMLCCVLNILPCFLGNILLISLKVSEHGFCTFSVKQYLLDMTWYDIILKHYRRASNVSELQDNAFCMLSPQFTCKWSMTANHMLPSNLTFDEILTVLLCESGSGQFRFSEHNFKKKKEMWDYQSSTLAVQGTAGHCFPNGVLLKALHFYSMSGVGLTVT